MIVSSGSKPSYTIKYKGVHTIKPKNKLVVNVIAMLVLFIAHTNYVNANTQTVTKETNDRINQLETTKVDKHQSMVDEALNRSSEKDITRVKDILNSEKYQARLNKYHNKTRQILGIDATKEVVPTSAEDTNVIGDRLVLFVSSSMPVHVLRNYVHDIDKVGGVMILRGTIGGIDSLVPTMNFLRQLIAENPNCTDASCKMKDTNISIDPERFSHHGIKKVPALIFEEDMKIQAYCKEGAKGPKADFIAYGDASLAGLTDVIYQQTKHPSLKALLNKLRGIK